MTDSKRVARKGDVCLLDCDCHSDPELDHGSCDYCTGKSERERNDDVEYRAAMHRGFATPPASGFLAADPQWTAAENAEWEATHRPDPPASADVDAAWVMQLVAWGVLPTDAEALVSAIEAAIRADLIANAIMHVNDGSAHDDAMAWSRGHTDGYNEARSESEAKVADLERRLAECIIAGTGPAFEAVRSEAKVAALREAAEAVEAYLNGPTRNGEGDRHHADALRAALAATEGSEG